MRVLTVLGIMTLGAGLGTAAVLVPLSTTPSASRSDWLVNWNVPAIRQIVAMLPNAPSPDAAASSGTKSGSEAPETSPQATPTVRSQDLKTFEVLTQQTGAVGTAGSRAELQPWKTTTTIAGGAVRASRPSSKPANEDQRYHLVRAIQAELTRVGCYAGSADGEWTLATRRAMGQFNDRLNATLPYDEPDLILLTLVKGHRGIACGETCPAGQQMTDGGLCRPSSVLAHADRPKAPRRLRLEPQPSAVASSAPQKPSEPTFGTTTVVATSESEQTVQVDQAGTDGSQTYGVTVRSAPPLPGRMSIGGPLAPALPDVRQPVTVTPEDEQSDSQPQNGAPPSRKAQRDGSAASVHKALPAIINRRPPPPARPPQVSVAQPKKQKWHPNNPFWQTF